MFQLKYKPVVWFSTFLLFILWILSAVPTHAYGTEDCRIGVIGGLHNETAESNQWIETLDASWYINFAPYPATYQNTFGETVLVDAEHVPVIRVKQDKQSVTGTRLDSYTMEFNGGQPLTEAVLTQFVQRNRGALWAIGNEPDREGEQDDTEPEVYARAYHEIRAFILNIDETAQFANAGLAQVTPGRIQYLDTMIETYQMLYGEPMPIDVWNIHVYPLEELTVDGSASNIGGIALGSDPSIGQRAPIDSSECNSGDPDSPNYNNNLSFVTDDVTCLSEHDDVRILRHQVETMRQWMKDNGEQDKPLIISEMGILWPYIEVDDSDPETCGFLKDEFGQCLSPRRVSRFMADANDYLLTASDPNLGYSKGSEHKLVQRWAWFSVYQTLQGREPGGSNDGQENETVAASSNLIDDPWTYVVPGQQSALTQMGRTLQSYAQTPESELIPNLYIDGVPDAYVVGQADNGWNEVAFSIPLRNDGNTSTDATTYVFIYADASFREPFILGRAEAHAGIGGCATDIGYATITIPVPPTVTEFYLRIRDDQTENDVYTADNVYTNPSGIPIATAIRYLQEFDGDDFEVDNVCRNGAPIGTDGMIQTHTFHEFEDVDWIQFDAEGGKVYSILGDVSSSSRADVVMDIYDSCDNEVVFEQNPAFSHGTELKIEAPFSGTYYVRFRNKDSSIFGNDVTYNVSVQEENQDRMGAVILVGGRSSAYDDLQPNIEHAVNKVYDLYRSVQQYPDDRIQFLSTGYVPENVYDPTVHELDGKDRERDGMPTKQQLEEAITSWALDYVSADQPLTIYMISHGNTEDHFFYLDRVTGEEEILHPETLNQWLNELEAQVPGIKINFVLEMCHAGSFIEANRPASSNSQRLMIASATSPQLAFASGDGAYFSDYFFQGIGMSRNVERAFREADEEVREITENYFPQMQTPILDANGNRIWNEPSDFELARQRGFGHAGTFSEAEGVDVNGTILYEPQFWPPLIETAESTSVQESSSNLEIIVTAFDDETITNVWADVYAPSTQTTQAEVGAQNEGKLAVFNGEQLTLILQEDNTYRNVHCFDEIGSYNAIIYAEDDDGLISQPETITFTVTEACDNIPLTVGITTISTTSILSLFVLGIVLLSLLSIVVVNKRP